MKSSFLKEASKFFISFSLLMCAGLPENARAQEALNWKAPKVLSSDETFARSADIVVASNKARVSAVWVENGNVRVKSGTSSPNGNDIDFSWENSNDFLSSTLMHGVASEPKIALSEDGEAGIAVWSGNDAGTMTIYYSIAGKVGNQVQWSEADALSASATGDIDQPAAAISKDGSTAIVVWRDAPANRIYARVATLSGTTVSLGIIQDISGAVGNFVLDPRVAISDDGTVAVAAWQSGMTGLTSVKAAVARLSGGAATWESPTAVSADLAVEYPINLDLALSGNGQRALAVWNNDFRVQTNSATITSSNTTWDSSATSVSPATGRAHNPKAALSQDASTAVVIWHWHDFSANHIIQVAPRIISNGSPLWLNTANVHQSGVSAESDDDGLIDPWIVLSADGRNATAIWTGLRQGINVLEGASGIVVVQDSTTRWSEVSVLSKPGDSVSGATKLSASFDAMVNFVTWPVYDANSQNQYIWSRYGTLLQVTPTPAPTVTIAPTITAAPTQVPSTPTPAVDLLVLKKKAGRSPLQAPKIKASSINEDSSMNVNICFPFKPLPPTADMYGLIERNQPKPKRRILSKRLRVNKRCLTVKLRFGTYEAFLRQDRFGAPSIIGSRIRFSIGAAAEAAGNT